MANIIECEAVRQRQIPRVASFKVAIKHSRLKAGQKRVLRLCPRDSRPHKEGQCQHQRARAKVQLGSRAFADRRAILIRAFAIIRTRRAAVAFHRHVAGVADTAVDAAAGTVRAASVYMTGESDRGERRRISRVVVRS